MILLGMTYEAPLYLILPLPSTYPLFYAPHSSNIVFTTTLFTIFFHLPPWPGSHHLLSTCCFLLIFFFIFLSSSSFHWAETPKHLFICQQQKFWQIWGLISRSGRVMWVKWSVASERLISAQPNDDKLLKHLPTESEEVMLAPAEFQLLPTTTVESSQNTCPQACLGTKWVLFPYLILGFLIIQHWNSDS